MDAKEDPQETHSYYCEKLVSKIGKSGLDYENLWIEREYGEEMDLEEFEHVGGYIHGDCDVLLDFGDKYLCIEVKTNPGAEDMKDGNQQLAKAEYLIPDVQAGLVLKDSQIDKISSEEISDWDLDKKQFETIDEWLTEKDSEKEISKVKTEKSLNDHWESDFNIYLPAFGKKIFPRVAY